MSNAVTTTSARRKGRPLAEGELIKHSAAIQASNSLSLLQRKVANVCLMHAFPRLASEEVHRLPLRELKRELGYRSHNDDKLRSAFRALNATRIEWNLFGKDRRHRWGTASLMAQAELIDGLICEYAYPPKLRQWFAQPEVYARLNLKVQNGFSSKHSLALWEFLVDALGAKRGQAVVELELAQFRRLLAIGDTEYTEFKALRRRVIEVAIGEINMSGDLTVAVEYRRKGRAVAALAFSIAIGPARAGRTAIDAPPAPPLASGPEGADEFAAGTPCSEGTLVEEFGIARPTARRLLSVHGPAYVEEVLVHVREAVRKGGIQSVAGYTVRAIERDFRPRTTAASNPVPTAAVVARTAARQDERAALEQAFEAWREEAAEAALDALNDEERQAVDQRIRAALSKTTFGSEQLEALDAGGSDGRAAYHQVAADLVLDPKIARDFTAFVARAQKAKGVP